MKLYVDELPKSCGDCVFCRQTEYYYYCDKLHTKLGYFDKEKDCPLQSLAEHDNQVRKEVCEEIMKAYENPKQNCLTIFGVINKQSLQSILDQKQGE